MNKYYSLKKLKNFADKRGIIYRLLIGKRSNGKTYAVLHDGLQMAIETGKKIAYIRRYKEDITKPNLETLLNPHAAFTAEITGGEWDDFIYMSRQFRLMNSETDTKGRVICDAYSLSAWERQKGSDKGEYCLIVFDEFITRDSYITNETDIFLDVLSTILRDRGGVPVYMIANTISQHCPYFAAFGFNIRDVKQGDIKQMTPYCCIEYCNDTGKQNNARYFTAFNSSHGKMITSGKWDFRNYPTLSPRSHLQFNFQLRFFIVLSDRKIAGEILTDKNGAFLYFYPFTGEIKHPDNTIIYGGGIDTNALHVPTFDSGGTSAHIIIRDLMWAGKCFYSDNETGDGVAAFIANDGDI